MTCNETQELFGTAIDGVLEKKSEGLFRQHISVCQHCRSAYELESMAKRIVRGKMKRAVTPSRVYNEIIDAIRADESVVSRTMEWWDRILSSRVVIPTFTTAAAAIVLYLLLSPGGTFDNSTRHTASNDIINQSIVNFALIRSGEMKPTVVSVYPEGVAGYFERNNTRFVVNVKYLENCDWYGALSSDYDGVKLAHIVYKMGDDLVYVYQVNENQLQPGSLLQLPPAAQKSLAETAWYTDPDHPGCNVVMWKTNGVVSTAVSTMKKDRLLALLTQ